MADKIPPIYLLTN